MTTTIDPKELEKFSALADQWWDESGKFKPLHRFNPLRIGYIRDSALAHFKRKNTTDTPLSKLSIIDIGCGGGLLAEPLARLGADVTAIDASEKNIKTAMIHAEKHGLTINYRHNTAEEMVKEKQQFDIVLSMEVIEHVANVPEFIASCAALVKPGGMLIIATLNRTVKSYALAIVGAEYILRWLPIGTHDWKKFLKPSEIASPLEQQHHMKIEEIIGASMHPLTQKWSLSDDVSVNYMVKATLC